MTPSASIDQVARALLSQRGDSLPPTLTLLPGGRNNRVWKVDDGARHYLLKQYFWSPDDPRDRLGQEWAFLTFLRQSGITAAPEPLAFDAPSRCALLEFVEGTPILPEEVTADYVHQASQFFLEIQEHRHCEDARLLPNVSEACFSLAEHLRVTEGRMSRLRQISPSDWPEAAAFARSELPPAWTELDKKIRSLPQASLEAVLLDDERCLSPSDFGFHNALRTTSGTLRFLDFEYAGWDDPAKTVADFCNQPDGLLAGSLAHIFREAVCTGASLPFPERLRERVAFLEPVYQIKWACICLNGFLPGGRMAGRRPDAQLARAREMLVRAQSSL